MVGRTDGTLPGQVSSGSSDAFVRKYDTSGSEVWTRQFGTANIDQAYGVSVDASGVYVAGATRLTGTDIDAFVRKYDTSGNEVWTRQFGALSRLDEAFGISVDASGVYVGGYTAGTLPGQVSSGGTRDAFVRKYDTSGNEVWTRQFGTADRDLAYGISVDASGVYVTGSTRGTFPGQTSSGSGDTFVRKYDTSGTEVWTLQLGTPSWGRGISVDASGVYVGGYRAFVVKIAFENQPPDCSSATIPDQIADETNCVVTISGADVTGITDPDNDPLTISVSPTTLSLGVNIVTVTADDGNGGICSIDISVNVDDITAPVADLPTLTDVTAECVVTELTPPTATDNCGGDVTVTNDAVLPISGEGTTIVTWTYDDGNGNTSTQTQNVIIDDITSPVADITALADVTSECVVTSLTTPTATDNCDGTVTVTNDAVLPISGEGTITLVTWTYDDGNGNTSTQTQNVIIDDISAPVPDLPTLADVTAECEVTSLTAPTATDDCSGLVTVTNDATLPITGEGTIVVTWTYDDGNGNTSTQTQNVIIDDITAPIIAGIPSEAIIQDNDADLCGAIVDFPIITATDNCSGEVNISAAPESGSFFPLGNTTVTVTATDASGNAIAETFNVIVENQAPVLSNLMVTNDPLPIGTSVPVTVEHNDNNLTEATIDWGDGSQSFGVIGEGVISGEYAYTIPGVYVLSIGVQDACGETASIIHQFMVVYDPDGGFVTGGGWINSPAGASTQYPLAVGKANFGFVSKYKKGATVPTGNTEFQFKAGDLNFKSDVYDWLVVAGEKAKFKGEGTINHAGNYGFMISAIDGDKKAEPDKFRIKIWQKPNEAIVYDNQIGASDDADPITTLGGGSIAIHDGNNKNARIAGTGNIPEELNEYYEISVYPNPVKEIVTIELTNEFVNEKEILEIHLFNMIGEELIYKNERLINFNTLEIDLKDIPAGIYMLVIPNGDKYIQYKLYKL